VRCKDLSPLRRLRFWALLSVPTVRCLRALQARSVAPVRPVVDTQQRPFVHSSSRPGPSIRAMVRRAKRSQMHAGKNANGAIMVRSLFFGGHHFERSNQLTRLSVADFGGSYRDRKSAEILRQLGGVYWRQPAAVRSGHWWRGVHQLHFRTNSGERIIGSGCCSLSPSTIVTPYDLRAALRELCVSRSYS
jgi:hypothetical protein